MNSNTSVSNNVPFKVNVYPVKGKPRSFFGKDTVENANKVIFSFYDETGKQQLVTVLTTCNDGRPRFYEKELREVQTYLQAFNAYSTEDNPNITPKELHQIKRNIMKNTNGTSSIVYGNGYGGVHGSVTTLDSTKRQDYLSLLDTYSDENSDGGKDITPSEQAEITGIFAKWYYQK